MPFRRTSVDSSQRTGFYSPKRSRVVGSRLVFPTDPDAAAYIAAVESADGQELEFPVKVAYNDFVLGCKSDGIWNAIKASCIMAGARTLAGALTPLVGTAPTNNNFVAGDYNRTTGLVGDGSTKYLNSNRANNTDPQNSRHIVVYASTGMSPSAVQVALGSRTTATNGVSLLFTAADNKLYACSAANDITTPWGIANAGSATSLYGCSRASSTAFTLRVAGSNYTISSTSETPDSANICVFACEPASPTFHTTARLAFYSIGESLDLALLDARVSGLMVAISGAIP